MTAETNAVGYAPLPQSLSSNSDNSDDEDDVHHEHRHHPNFQVHLERNDSVLSREDDQSRISDTTAICQNGRFYPLDETRSNLNRTRTNSSFTYSNDNVPIMILDSQSRNDFWKRNQMSLLRKLSILASILLCILVIIIFLYALPCSSTSSCTPKTSSVAWDRTLQGIEILGRISITPNNLIFLAKVQQYGNTKNSSMYITKGGVLAMQSTTGTPAWQRPLKEYPKEIDCEMHDTDGSGQSDCLITGENGMLACVDPLSGKEYWYSEVPTYETLPLPMPDIDGDCIRDLISVEEKNDNRSIVFLSGTSGKLIYRLFVPECHEIELHSISSNFVLSYTCDDNSTDYSHLLQLQDIVKPWKPCQIPSENSTVSYTYPSHRYADVWDLTEHHRLHVRNTIVNGTACPYADTCRSKVQLTLKYGNKSLDIWNHTATDSFVSQPARMNITEVEHTTGFAVKFWNWTATEIKKNETYSTKLHQQKFSERVTIVYVNGTDVHAMNASQIEINQICKGLDCQPSLPQEIYSIAIADINEDGILELISYRTSYSSDKNINTATLASVIQVIKLDAVF
ncbi:uncharacterized protein LOC106648262 isoform X1 [Trichogramma pretiosum]|uniref:uncharacterized protein LOC106648262 isoform X1 n=1 Tax=Trichogramma pretiosum TaxID=7493 RepID=UPI0006C99A38|nr:uncharacterized protein LOC106648262 isoform X1 [Trichogramma pretiosum]